MRCVSLILCGMLWGCGGGRETQLVAQRTAPDGKHVLWVMNESGGLHSGVVSLHLTTPSEKPTPKNQVFLTPECSNAVVRWEDRDTVVIIYDALFASQFHSGLISEASSVPRVRLFDRKAKSIPAVSNGVLLPCDPL